MKDATAFPESGLAFLARMAAELGLSVGSAGPDDILAALRGLKDSTLSALSDKPTAWAPRHTRTGKFMPLMAVSEEEDGVNLAEDWNYAPLFAKPWSLAAATPEGERAAYEAFLVNEEGCPDQWLRRDAEGEYEQSGVRAGRNAWQARARLE